MSHLALMNTFSGKQGPFRGFGGGNCSNQYQPVAAGLCWDGTPCSLRGLSAACQSLTQAQKHSHRLQKCTGYPVTALAALAIHKVSLRTLLRFWPRQSTEAHSLDSLCVQRLLGSAVFAVHCWTATTPKPGRTTLSTRTSTPLREPGPNQPTLFELGSKVCIRIKK